MKKSLIALTALAGILVFALARCSGSGASSSASSASSSASASSAASSASAESSSAPSEASGSSGLVGMPNPWHTVSSARDAAAGSGISGFVVPEGESISLGTIVPHDYRYMEGLAEADVPFPAVQMTIRKGVAPENGDVSGDYNKYAHTWTQNVGGVDVTCSGNREGEATKTIWTAGDYSFCILVQGLGGDDDYGLGADDLAILVGGIQ